LSFCFVLTVGGISRYWSESSTAQREVLADLEAALPENLPSDAVIILAGECPYRGPAIVFESSWDLTGALTHDDSDNWIYANVVTSQLELERTGLSTMIYGKDDGRYLYGPHLYLYDHRDRTVNVLRDRRSAERSVGRWRAAVGDECPKGAEGWGVPVLPFERLLVEHGLVLGHDALR
jgi:hypothetical protein